MSGITGLYNLDGRPAADQSLRLMTAAVAHRGPDGIQHWLDGAVGLGHLLLQTTPESAHEKQPLTNQDGTLCITMDGRIDNRLELTRLLHSKGSPPRNDTDAELVLRAYECWGEECPNRLLGDFAFAIWDARKQQLFCVRDYVGVKPFYYHRSGSLFAFGSEIRAVLALDTVPRRLNESRLADFLVEELDREDEESTFYQDVQRLPAGHSLSVGPGGFALRDYWDLKAPPVLKLGSLREYGEAFREIFLEAVRCRLRSSHPVGSTLSGGIDSSSVVCTIRELLAAELKEPLHTISLVDADESRCGETPFIREVLRGGGLTPHIVRSDQVSPMTEQMTDSDEPFEIFTYFTNWFGFAAAKKAGVRVLLDGISGDHIIPPYTYLATLARSWQWNTLRRELSFGSREFGESRLSILRTHGLAPMMPGLFETWRRLRGRKLRPYPEGSCINPDFALRMGIQERFELKRRKLWAASQNIGTLHSWSFTCGVLPFFFEHSGRLAATMGIEARHPFSDRRVIEFFLSLPLPMKTYSPLPKRVIREGMQGILPEMVRSRTLLADTGGAFMTSLLKQDPVLSVPELSNQALGPAKGYVNLDAIKAGKDRVDSGFPEAGDSVWQALNLALWLGSRRLHPA
ncbi:MAG: asparagine synthase (glutamine-hydrolyzing) [Acidobacteriia bacterium]|nr:asparagine synthase (glutamine-hydrolyzing) [Terriglobia bacterium]